MESTLISVKGMSCDGCVRNVTKILLGVPGVASAEVSLQKEEAQVEFDPSQASRADLLRAINAGGFESA